MKILYDHQAFTGQRFGGVSRYFHELMESLLRINIKLDLSILFSNNDYLKKSSFQKPRSFSHFLGYKFTNQLVSNIDRLLSIFKLIRGDFDIFHPTFFHSYFLYFIRKKPFVLTYHDCIKERFNLNHVDNATQKQKKELLCRASKIIAVSENTKKDIVEFYQIDERKIVVIHHTSNFRHYKLPQNYRSKSLTNYLLYVGARNDYKNFIGFLNDISTVLRKRKDIHLLCAGGGAFTKDENVVIAKLGLQNQVIYQYFDSDDTLFSLYKNAIAFVYPSLYEGFGIPIIEAFACGCPVVLSNRSCFPEVAGEAALYFNPDNPVEVALKIEEIITNQKLRNSLIIKGINRQKKFSTQKQIRDTLAVYQSVLNSQVLI